MRPAKHPSHRQRAALCTIQPFLSTKFDTSFAQPWLANTRLLMPHRICVNKKMTNVSFFECRATIMRQLAHPKNQSSPKCHRKIRSNCPQNALASPPKKQSSPKCHREPQQIAPRAQNERQNERQNDVYACIVSRRSAIIYAFFVRLCVLLRCVDDASFDGKESKDHR